MGYTKARQLWKVVKEVQQKRETPAGILQRISGSIYLFWHIYPSIFLSFFSSINLYQSRSIFIYLHWSPLISIYLFIYLSFFLSFGLYKYIYLYIYLSTIYIMNCFDLNQSMTMTSGTHQHMTNPQLTYLIISHESTELLISLYFYFCHSTRFYHNLKKEIRIYGYTNPVLSTLYPDVPWFAIPNLSVAPGAMNVDKQSVLHFVRHCPIATMPEFFLLQTLQKPDSRWQSRAPTFSRGGSTRRDSLLTLVIINVTND